MTGGGSEVRSADMLPVLYAGCGIWVAGVVVAVVVVAVVGVVMAVVVVLGLGGVAGVVETGALACGAYLT